MKENYVLDANESLFLQQELNHIMTETYEIEYPALKCRQVIPVSFEGGKGAKTISYRQFDRIGMAKLIANYADDLPRVDIKGQEFVSPVKPMADAYGYNIFDIAAAAQTKLPLDRLSADAAKQAMMTLENDIAFKGDSDTQLPGLLNNKNTPVYLVPNDGDNNQTTFASKDAEKIIRDINAVLNGVVENTNNVEVPTDLLMPVSQYALIASKPVPNLNMTILNFILKNNPFLKNVDWANELKGAGTKGTDVMLAYNRNPKKLKLIIPWDFEQLSAERKGLEYIVPCVQTIGGTVIVKPLSLNIAEGI